MASIKENGSIWPVCTLSKHAGEIRAFEQQIRSVDELVTACIQNVYAASQDEIFTYKHQLIPGPHHNGKNKHAETPPANGP